MTGMFFRFDVVKLYYDAYRIGEISKNFAALNLPSSFGQAEGRVPEELVNLANALRDLGNTFTGLCEQTQSQIAAAAQKLESTDQSIGASY